MNKKFLSAILFGALMVTSTGTFVSCKDYDDDIDAINKELTDVKSQIAALQAKVDAGKWITSASQTAAGVTITLSDGSSLNITNGKDGQDGAQGAAGQDGKNGTVVTVNENGVLCLDGVETAIKVAEEAPAAKPCVKVENDELYVLNAEGEYVASGIKACGVTAVNTNGVWTITVDGESITVPGSAALTSIAIQGEKDLVYNYGYFTKDVEWGFNKEEKAEAGFYSRLKEDVQVLLNPAEADGAAFTYTFRNSVKAVEGITFFGEARPSTAVLTRAAASANGVWTLPAAVTKHDATSISELRNELYLNFKQNDKEYYAMSLEAVDGLGNVSTRSDYEYKISLAQAGNSVSVADMNCLVAQEYFPTVVGPVIDYKIQVNPTITDKRKAEAFGIEIVDGKGFIANNESAVFNDVKFQVAYVTINGVADKTTFTASFANEFTSSDEVRVEEMKKALNATVVRESDGTIATPKRFVFSHTYDLSEMYDNLSEDVQLLLTEKGYVNAAEAELIGGESSGDENYNEFNRNELLENNISWSYNADKKQITVNFIVSENIADLLEDGKALKNAYEAAMEEGDLSWVEYSNFQLNTAYQLNLSITDGLNGTEVAKFELPFEFTQPEIEEVGVSRNTEGTFSKWATHDEYWDEIEKNHHCDVLYLFGAYDNNKFYMPLYDAFNIWTKAPYNTKNLNPNAEYYTLESVDDYRLDGTSNAIDMTDVKYVAQWQNYPAYLTWTGNDEIKKAVANQGDVTKRIHEKEAWTYVETAFDFYGVYPATEAQLGYYGEGNSTTAGFRLVFASTIQKSTIETNDEVYYASAGTNRIFISNDDIAATTMLDTEFVLFDGLYGNTAMTRSALNYERGFNEAQRPFAAVSDYEIFAQYADESYIVEPGNAIKPGVSSWVEDKTNGEYVINSAAVATDGIKAWYLTSKSAQAVGTDYPFGMKAQNGGIVIALGNDIDDRQPVVVTIRVKDTMGFYKDLKVTVQKLK